MITEEPKKEDNRIRYLYCIICKSTGKIYIGQSLRPFKRWKEHKKNSTKLNPPLLISKKIKQYGISNFSFKIIAACKGLNNTNYTEVLLIKQFESHISKNGYNVSWGGSGIKPKTRKGISGNPQTQFKKGHRLLPKSLKQLSNSQKGKPSWNKGTVGVMKPNATSFKEGQESLIKNTHGIARNGHTANLDASTILYIYNSLLNNILTKEEVISQFNMNDRKINDLMNGTTYNYLTGKQKIRKISKLTANTVLYIFNQVKNCSKNDYPKIREQLCIELDVKSPVIDNIKNGKTHSKITQDNNLISQKLNPNQVLYIIDCIKNQMRNKKDLAKEMGISLGTIYHILDGTSWSEVTGIPKHHTKLKSKQKPVI